MAQSNSRIGLVSVPARFESLRDTVGANRVSQVLLEPSRDLPVLRKAIAEVRAARQGKLLFLQGAPGSGKTSLAESLGIYLNSAVGTVLTSPLDYHTPLASLPAWISQQKQKVGNLQDKVLIVNLDGREIENPDKTATMAAMTNLNALLRTTPDLLLLWPIINRNFADEAISQLTQAGGHTGISSQRIHEVIGIGPERYLDVLQLILRTVGVTLADAAISAQEAEHCVAGRANLGEYLEAIQSLVVSRYDLGEIGAQLPRISFVATSDADLNPICRLLRRGSGYLIDPDRLLQYSRSNIAEDWKKRGSRNARHALPFIASLFEAKLLSASSSAVVNACASFGDPELRAIVRSHYPSPVSSNAWNSILNSSLVRSLNTQEDVGKGVSQASDAIQKAYLALQAQSKTKHRLLNEAIVTVLKANITTLPAGIEFEFRPLSDNDKELRVDVWCPYPDRPATLEFTHRSNATEAVVSTYVLTKIQDYARDYGLI